MKASSQRFAKRSRSALIGVLLVVCVCLCLIATLVLIAVPWNGTLVIESSIQVVMVVGIVAVIAVLAVLITMLIVFQTGVANSDEVTVPSNHAAVIGSKGRRTGISVGPVVRINRSRQEQVNFHDLRECRIDLRGEGFTLDHKHVVVDAFAVWHITNVEAYLSRAQDPKDLLKHILEAKLNSLIEDSNEKQLQRNKETLTYEVSSRARSLLAQYGMSIVALHIKHVKLTPSTQLRHMFQTHVGATNNNHEVERRRRISEVLTEYFDLDELREMCFNLNIEYENIRGDTRSAKVIGVILYCERHELVSNLETQIRKKRPSIRI